MTVPSSGMQPRRAAGPDPAPEPVEVEVPAALAGERLDRAVSLVTGVARRVASDLVSTGAVKVDGRHPTSRSQPLRSGQRLSIELPAPSTTGPVPDASVPFRVVHEDPELVVIDKPAGVVVHHGAGHLEGTLVDGLVARYPELGGLAAAGVGDPARPGIVHRLDKGTSGLLVVARTATAYRHLAEQFKHHRAARRYWALVVGSLDAEAGVIDAPVGRSARSPTRMTVSSQGRPARTSYRVERRFESPVPTTLVDVTLDTGRTHQVRVHLTAIGHPVVGDDRDGGPRARPSPLADVLPPERFFLHAHHLALDHPDGGPVSWDSALPDDLRHVLEHLHR